MSKNSTKRGPRKPYLKPGLMWEDPFDGYGPEKHRSQKKGARQHGKKLLHKEMRE